jgi:hypothetical protein
LPTRAKILVDKYVNNALYLVARSGSAPEMGTVSDFGLQSSKVREIFETEEKQHGDKEEGSKKEKALTPGSGSRNSFRDVERSVRPLERSTS